MYLDEAAVRAVLRWDDLRRWAVISSPNGAGPLDEGQLADETVTCPWHGSVFSMRDGTVLHGPATMPQPDFNVRVQGGRICKKAAQWPEARTARRVATAWTPAAVQRMPAPFAGAWIKVLHRLSTGGR